MLFNSYAFLFVFLPITLCLYWSVRTLDARKRVSIVASYAFYSVWSWRFAALMLLTTSVDYFTARWIEDSPNAAVRRRWLALSMAVNLGVLMVFKYFNFFAGALNALLPIPLPLLRVVLPIGISFYTFESMSYTIDVYRNKVHALRRFIDYAHFVTMFPRLVSGPIVRYADLAEQLKAIPQRLPVDNGVRAIHFFVTGLAKKMLVADTLAATLVDPLFADTAHLGLVPAWAAVGAYTAQLYFDFSGYSDMAVGLAFLLGLELPRNFRLPYQAANISEFWTRWHVSLSSWLRDYLYIPLGGNRGSRFHTAWNKFVTMVLGGLWHGANWTFVAWGAWHGTALLAYTMRPTGWRVPRALAVAGTLLVVMGGWVLFRSASLSQAGQMYQAMAGLNGLGTDWILPHGGSLLWLVFALVVSLTVDTYDLPFGRPRHALALGVLAVLCLTRMSTPSPFLYFQF